MGVRIAGVLLLGIILAACRIPAVQGSGNMLRENLDIDGFHRVLFSGHGELVITAGDEEALSVIGDETLLPLINTEVHNGTLIISEEALDDRLVLFSEPINYFLTVDDLTALAVNTPGTISVDQLSGDRIMLEAGAGGRISVQDLTAAELIVRVGGTSVIEVAGGVDIQKILVKEMGVYQASHLLSRMADVTLSEAGSGTVWVEEFLDVKISGRGDLELYGAPEIEMAGPGPGKVTTLGEK